MNINADNALDDATDMKTNQTDTTNGTKKTDRTEKEHGSSNEKTMLRNMIITVAHKIYLDRYFSLLKEEDTMSAKN